MTKTSICAAVAALTISTFGIGIGMAQRKPTETADSTEMKRIVDDDQADRNVNIAVMTPAERQAWTEKAGPRDTKRRQEVLDLISRGALRTGKDFGEAALVFQHGYKADENLLAHTLAVVAIAKGSSESRWIAAATLDRYLHAIKQPQIYGTQFSVAGKQGDKWTQSPYNRQLIPDALLTNLCVHDRTMQKQVVDLLNSGTEPPDSKVPGC